MNNDKIVSIRINNELYKEAVRFASLYGLSFSQFVRLLLEKEVRGKGVEFVKFHNFDNMF